jgi:3-hydroxyisobutyrate dehydrogenase
MASKQKIGFLGLGAMGLGMAACLAKAGFEVKGFDINQKAVERLVTNCGRAASTPRAAASESDILIVVVATSDQTSSALFDQDSGALAGLPQNSTILLCITCAPEYVFDLRQRLDATGRPDVKLIDCPISGGEVRAWQGNLSLLCAGSEVDVKAIHDVLECLGSQLHLLPGCIGAGSSVKMVHQILVGVHILASVEVIGLAYVDGLDLQSTYDSVMRGEGASWLFGQRVAHMLSEEKVPASSLMIIAKDFVKPPTLVPLGSAAGCWSTTYDI